MVNAQEWLDENYPKKQRWTIEKLDLSNLNLEGDLDLDEFHSLEEINISGNPQLGEVINNRPFRNVKAPVKIKAQDWLDWKYPNKKKIKKIESKYEEKLEGELIITGFPDLEELKMEYQESLTKLQVNDCPQLTKLDCRKSNKLKELIISNCSNLNELNCQDNLLTSLDLKNNKKIRELCASNTKLDSLDLSNLTELQELRINDSELTELKLGKLGKLAGLYCSNNQLTELDVTRCPNLKVFSCDNNFFTGLDCGQNKKLETLHISKNNFPEQDLSWLSHLVNLKRLNLGNNYFTGSLKPLRNMTKLETLDISDTDINSGVEYLSPSIQKTFCSFKEKPQSKVKEIAWQLDLFENKTQKKWEKLGFALKEIKQWIEIGLSFDDHNFAHYLKKEKNLNPQAISRKQKKLSDPQATQEIKNTLARLENEYNASTWKIIHPDFTPELQKDWENKGFTYEQTWGWIEDGKLKPEESSLAKYLQDKGISSQDLREEDFFRAANRPIIHKLREEFSNLDRKNKIPFSDEEEIIEIGNWENIHPGFIKRDEGWDCQKYWEHHGLDYHQTKRWIDKGLNPWDFDFAICLKINGHQTANLLTSDLIQLKKEYYNPQTWLEFWHPTEKRKTITDLDISNQNLRGDLIIDGWENLEKIDCSVDINMRPPRINNFPNINLNNLPQLISFGARRCKIHKLTISNCPQLICLYLDNNYLTDLDFLNDLKPEKLAFLCIRENNLPSQDLSFFNKFKNLEILDLGHYHNFKIENKFNRFCGSLEPLQNLTKLRYLNISETDVDRGLEYLPDSVKVFCCYSLSTTDNACGKISKELQDYCTDIVSGSYNPQAWKEHQVFFKSLVENLSKTNPKLKDARKFLQEQNIFFNVKNNTFQGNLQGSLSLLQLNKSLLDQKETKISFLETEIKELTEQVEQQKERIINACLLFSEDERKLLEELITIHIKYIKFKERGVNSSGYGEKCEEYESKCKEIKERLYSRLTKEIMNEVRHILINCEKLATQELAQETKTDFKLLLLEEKNQIPKIILADKQITIGSQSTQVIDELIKGWIQEKIGEKIGRTIEKVENCPTWFNDNCSLIISKKNKRLGKSSYHLWVATYEPAFGKTKTKINCFKIAKLPPIRERWADIIEYFKRKLNSENPAAELYNNIYTFNLPPLLQDYNNITKSKIKIFFQDSPDDYLKPYDIIKRKMPITGHHIGIYLGNGKVAHISGESKKDLGARIDTWEDFLKEEKEIEIEHAFIPFKKPELIQEHIDLAVKSKFGEGQYHLLKNNCEHFAKMCVYGLGMSQQSKVINTIAKGSDYLLQAIKTSNESFEKLRKEQEAQMGIFQQQAQILQTNPFLPNQGGNH